MYIHTVDYMTFIMHVSMRWSNVICKRIPDLYGTSVKTLESSAQLFYVHVYN